jgi:hypothetical protein
VTDQSGVFRTVKMNLTSKGELFYSLFVGPCAPPESIGSVGDIAVQTPSRFQDDVICTARKKNARVVRGKNHESHKIYYRTDSNLWRSIDEDRKDGERRCIRLNRPYTIHPTLKSTFVLEEYVFRWRRSTSYFDQKSNTSNNRQIEESSPSRKRTQAVVTSGDHGGKRLRMEIPPSIVNNTRSTPYLAHEGNRWILDQYLLWNSPPISNIHQTHRRGCDILTKLIELPDVIPHGGTAMKYVRLLEDIEHGPFTPEPKFGDVMHDLTQGTKANISKVNFGLGSRVSHVSIMDVISSLCQAGDPLKRSSALLGALTIPETEEGLGKCALTAGPFKGSTNHVYERRRDKRPIWLSSINPRGAITDPHIDYCGCSQFVQHIEGRKLWLFWPPTPHNLQLFCKKYVCGTVTEFSMMAAIEEFEKLELLLVEDGKSFVIPSGMIHGVMTFMTSCHTGFKLWGFDDFETATDLFNINFEVSQDQINLDDTQLDHYNEFFEHLEETEFKKLGELCRKNVGDERSQNILSWIDECKRKLSTR